MYLTSQLPFNVFSNSLRPKKYEGSVIAVFKLSCIFYLLDFIIDVSFLD